MAAGVAALTFGAFAGTLDHAFVEWDDPEYVVDNTLVRTRDVPALMKTVVALNYHPVTMLSLALNAGQPLSPGPFLATNVVLHAANTVLVFWLVLAISGHSLLAASLVAAIFGVHPMHVESVAWVSGRKDVLSALFLLAGALAYWRYLERLRRTWLGLAFALFLLACLAKATAVVFPGLLVLLDFLKGRGPWRAGMVLEKLPFLAVSLVVGLIAVDVQAGGDLHGWLDRHLEGRRALAATTPFTPYQRLALPAYGHLMYVCKFFVPAGLSAFYPYPSAADADHPKYLMAPLFLVATVALGAWSVRRAPALAFGIGWYLATVALVLQWLPVGAAIMADRYTYLPYVGLAFPLAMGVRAAASRRPRLRVALRAGAGAFVALLCVLTIRQVATWKNDETLWSAVIRHQPGTEFAYANRGIYLRGQGRDHEALGDLREAVRLGARRGEVFANLGMVHGSLGDLDSALVLFDQALRLSPGNGVFHYNRALAYLRLHRPREALADLDHAVAGGPLAGSSLHAARGHAHLQLGRHRQAAAEFDRAVAAGGATPGTLYHRGLCRKHLGDLSGAVADFRAVLRSQPGHAGARAELREMGASSEGDMR